MYQEILPQIRKIGRQAGMTLLELIIACAILLILASAAMPVARYTVKRQKEVELRRELREMRDAIDRYKDAADRNLIRGEPSAVQRQLEELERVLREELDESPSEETRELATRLIEEAALNQEMNQSTSIEMLGQAQGGQNQGSNSSNLGQDLIRHVRFLRHIPVDPMTGKAEWGRRSVQDDPDSTSWGGKNVFDVFSLSTSTALDGSKYSDW